MSLMSEYAPNVDAGHLVQHSAIRASPLTESLRPFAHQVGGHSALSQTQGRIWKPMISKELSFYQHIWSEDFKREEQWLRHWTPRFYGLFEREKMPEQVHPSVGPLEKRLSSHLKSKEIQLSAQAFDESSPWGKRLKELRQKQKPMVLYVCLEDLTAKFKVPCILDCKLGTRTYDDDASPAKAQRHMEKCRITTSGTLGIRFSGMQTYRKDTNEFLFRDKYYGRKLRAEDLLGSLVEFFNNGERIRFDIARKCLESLQVLLWHLEKQKHFFFYSSSMLIVYEGSDDAEPLVDVRMIDFAHTQRSFGKNDPGCALGVSSLVNILSRMVNQMC
eukprot:Plantae.Rhodophyta-Purpureofilum_apyrenoidigerum.ctg894.p1 GENE.Plantae.Rhodophyta-Purpureofilum_apyrenoidigerum.ctg894~~Plantae.Rhodophyta-Purpureofilum_apyrenoidigerum.ctg894.p1  ORF type:complete len:331 (+),score=45.91 Plantae.Rhodophyta-Purpureofilum_apyrenoidigerum.ctg894:372-1364(+)